MEGTFAPTLGSQALRQRFHRLTSPSFEAERSLSAPRPTNSTEAIQLRESLQSSSGSVPPVERTARMLARPFSPATTRVPSRSFLAQLSSKSIEYTRLMQVAVGSGDTTLSFENASSTPES